MTLGVGGTRVARARGQALRFVLGEVRWHRPGVKRRVTNVMRRRMAVGGFALTEAIGYRCTPAMERPRRHAAHHVD
jgi:hypothetical protein